MFCNAFELQTSAGTVLSSEDIAIERLDLFPTIANASEETPITIESCLHENGDDSQTSESLADISFPIFHGAMMPKIGRQYNE